MNEEEIFQIAAAMPAAERGAYLLTACEGQATLRRRVERLLASHDHDAFMKRPANRSDSSELQAELARLKPEESDDRIGNFKLLQKLGEGGFGTVWMAEQLEPVRRRVALKIIKPGMDTREVIVRFEQERQALALMDHPNIAKVLDAGVTPLRRPFFAMELVRGIRITDFCDQNALPTRERLELFIAVCNAIQHAHQKGIIHRDIKPSNILVTLHDGVPVPKVIDFGVAKAIQSQRLTDLTFFTRFEQMIGTPLYMSPEQAEMSGLDIDTRSDIYSLGVLLYELLTGTTPFDAKKLMALGIDAMRKTIREMEPVRPSTRLSQLQVASGKPKLITRHSPLSTDLDWIVMKCLEKDRTRRYNTANGLASDIRRHINNEAVLARPPSAAYRFQKMFRRNKLAFAAVASMTAVLVLGVVVSTWQAIRATRANASEVAQRQLAVMQLALQAWEEGDLQRASDLIDGSRPAAGQSPGFEWRYLRKLCQDQSYETFGGPNHKYRSAQFFDRDWLLLNDGKALTLHNLSRGDNQWLLDDEDGIWFPALCSGNTNLLATLTDDGRIKVWDLAARRVRAEFEGQPHSPTADFDADDILTFSRDGRWLASVTSDRSLKLRDVEAGNSKPARTFHRYDFWASGGVFSLDGRYLFSGGCDPMIRIWDVATGAEAAAPLEGHTSWVLALAMSPDGLRLAAGGTDSTVILWDVSTRKIVAKFIGHLAMVKALAFSPDGQILASGSRDQTIRLWDTKTGQQLSLLRGHGAEVKWLRFSPDGRWLASRSNDGLVKVWQVTPAVEGNALTRDRSAQEVTFSPDGRCLVSAGADLAVDLWDLPTRSQTFLKGHVDAVMTAAFSPDGRMLASGSHDQTVRLWDVRDHRAVATLTNGFPVGSLAFSPDGRTLIVGGSKHYFLVGGRGGLQFWDVPSQQATGTVPGNTSDIVQVALSDDGFVLATGHTDGAVTLWEGQTRRALHRFESQYGGAVLSLAFSPTEPLLAASKWGGNIVLYDTTTMEVVPPSLKAHTGRVTSLAFSPDGRTLASAGEGGGLKLWRMATRQVALTLKGHLSAVKGVAFSRDGTFMASCGLDGTVRLWPAATLEQADSTTQAKMENQ